MKSLSYERRGKRGKTQTFEGGKEVRSGLFGYGTNVAETLKSPDIAIVVNSLYRCFYFA